MNQQPASLVSCSTSEGYSLVRYFVASGRGGGWLIFREGKPRAVNMAQQKLKAVETARAMAQVCAPSQVMVEGGNGAFFLRYEFDPTGALRLQ